MMLRFILACVAELFKLLALVQSFPDDVHRFEGSTEQPFLVAVREFDNVALQTCYFVLPDC